MDLKRIFAGWKIKVVLALFVVIYLILYNVYSSTSNKYISSSVIRWLDVWQKPSDSKQWDIHIEDEFEAHGMEDEFEAHGTDKNNELQGSLAPGTTRIAIGSGITSKNMGNVGDSEIKGKFQLFSKFIPTFCETASPGFEYHFYLAFDATDKLFGNQEFLAAFEKTFKEVTSELCSHIGDVALHLVQCTHTGKPAWAQNDAMMEAYLDNMDYHYRVNDDTIMKTGNWTEAFIAALDSFVPPNVGVVGPKHSGGNTGILTYDFVHRSHIDVFGFYYPRIFPDWYADGWITRVYRPYRSRKIDRIRLVHTLSMGQRYKVTEGQGALQPQRVIADKIILNRYINYTRGKKVVKAGGRKVISMSLFGKDPNHMWGAIRNAQTAPVFFPGWKLRIYVPRSSKIESTGIGNQSFVPKRILRKLKQLGAEISFVKTKSIPPSYWPYFVIDDRSVDYFIVRNAQSRLSERDAIVVNDWLQQHSQDWSKNAFHCIRDHPHHAKLPVVDGLWGGNRPVIREALKKPVADLFDSIYDNQNRSANHSAETTTLFAESRQQADAFNVLRDILWPLMSSNAYCHDSVSCDEWPNTRKFPIARHKNEFLGQEFDQHQEPVSSDTELLKTIGNKCTDVVKPH